MNKKQTVKRRYSFIINGKYFQKEKTFEGRNGSIFFNDIEQQIKEQYNEDRIENIDHTSRIIHLKY